MLHTLWECDSDAYDDLFLEISRRYGFVNGDSISKKGISFNSDIGTGVYFYVTGGYCDCNSPIGSKKPGKKELNIYLNWLQALKKCKKLKAMYIMKYWAGSDGTSELHPTVTVSIDEVDAKYLANMAPETFYRIEYFKRYY